MFGYSVALLCVTGKLRAIKKLLSPYRTASKEKNLQVPILQLTADIPPKYE